MPPSTDRSTLLGLLGLLREATLHLAQPADEQIAYLLELGVGNVAEELALELEDVAPSATLLVDAGMIDLTTYELLGELADRLEDLRRAQRAGLWAAESLHASPEWHAVRSLARRLLVRLPES